MNKSIILIIVIILLFISFQVSAEEFSYDEFLRTSEKYSHKDFDIVNNDMDYSKSFSKFIDIIFNEGISSFISSLKSVLLVICILIISSVITSFSEKSDISKIAMYSTYIITIMIILVCVKDTIASCITAVEDICDYMNISFPGIAVLLASCGYSGTATTMQGIFVLVSNLIAKSIKNILIPTLYSCAILTLANGISNSVFISKLTDYINKIIKYAIGIVLTIFGAIVSFAGFTGSAADGIVLKTAKYAVANFVPVVGSCLSDTLNSIMSTSVILKNTVGYTALFIIMMICILPAIKIFAISFIFKLLALSASMLNHEVIYETSNSISETITTFAALLIFLCIIFILLIGIVITVGG